MDSEKSEKRHVMAAKQKSRKISGLGDKSLVVFALFRTSKRSILTLVRDYVKAWTRVNSTWVRIWRSNVIREERLNYYSEFQAEPYVEDESEETFSIVFEVRPNATR